MSYKSVAHHKTVLVTGFLPFKCGEEGIAVNPSSKGVELMNTESLERRLNITVIREVLPVEYKTIDANVPRMWDLFQPDLTIHVGVGPVDQLTLEKQATKAAYTLPDNLGLIPDDKKNPYPGPDLLATDLQVDSICKDFNYGQNEFSSKAVASDDAGKYICEYIYYTSLCKQLDKAKTSLFIHVPIMEYEKEFKMLAERLERMVEVCVAHIRTFKSPWSVVQETIYIRLRVKKSAKDVRSLAENGRVEKMSYKSGANHKTVLVTGFLPFKCGEEGIAVNPSSKGVELMNTESLERRLNITVIREVLPVEYKAIDANVPKMWDFFQPDLTIHVGVGPVDQLTLEKQATKAAYTLPDNLGLIPDDKKNPYPGPDLLATDLQVDSICKDFNYGQNEFSSKAVASDDAGKYICEYIYYTSLCKQLDRAKTSLFIHVPMMETEKEFKMLAERLERMVEVCVAHIRTYKSPWSVVQEVGRWIPRVWFGVQDPSQMFFRRNPASYIFGLNLDTKKPGGVHLPSPIPSWGRGYQ